MVLHGARYDRRFRLGHRRLNRDREGHRIAGMRCANAARRRLLHYVLQVGAETIRAVEPADTVRPKPV